MNAISDDAEVRGAVRGGADGGRLNSLQRARQASADVRTAATSATATATA